MNYLVSGFFALEITVLYWYASDYTMTSWVTLTVFGAGITLCSSFDMTSAAIITCISPVRPYIISELMFYMT